MGGGEGEGEGEIVRVEGYECMSIRMGIERRLISEMFSETSGLMHIQYAHDNHSDLDIS